MNRLIDRIENLERTATVRLTSVSNSLTELESLRVEAQKLADETFGAAYTLAKNFADAKVFSEILRCQSRVLCLLSKLQRAIKAQTHGSRSAHS